MEFKGTKGEWALSEKKTFGRQMVDLGDFNGYIDVWYHNGESITKNEATANAKLIAAAPRLLNALRSAYRCSGERNTLTKPVLDEMLKAINKALN